MNGGLQARKRVMRSQESAGPTGLLRTPAWVETGETKEAPPRTAELRNFKEPMMDCSSCTISDVQTVLAAVDGALRGTAAVLTPEVLCCGDLDAPPATVPHYSQAYLARILEGDAADLVDVASEALLFARIGAPVAALVCSPLLGGLVCARDAESAVDSLECVDAFVPFRSNASELRAAISGLSVQKNESACLLVGNLGLLAWANSAGELGKRVDSVQSAVAARCEEGGASAAAAQAELSDDALVQRLAPRLRSLLGADGRRVAVVASNAADMPRGGLLPEQLPLADTCFCDEDTVAESIRQFRHDAGVPPKVVALFGQGAFFAGGTLREANQLRRVFREALAIERNTHAFGGPNYLSATDCDETRRATRCANCSCHAPALEPRLAGKVCVVTGGAQGFGLGIARNLACEGATVCIADLNEDGAQNAADQLNEEFGPDTAAAFAVNIAEEPTVAAMMAAVVRTTGGVDVFVANAGVLKACGVKEFDKRDWDLVTDVNYTGYFLCTKHCSSVMARQAADGEGPWMDIVQINSKSGLEGSNRNAAYAGSKFGTLGLTQSFAKELVEDKIKVNSICPGNFFDGPLWSDPEKGLFVQYLNTGKVPGAKTIEEVKHAYEAKVPMGRGCTPEDVARAILYVTEQTYETGQAIPVTGGQVMLK